MNETSRIIGPLLHFFFPSISAATEANVHYFVRKTAHFTEYFILAVMGLRAAFMGKLLGRAMQWLAPIALVALVASLDEFNQSFEASRTSSINDVMLDIFGGLCGAAFVFLLNYYAARRILAE